MKHLYCARLLLYYVLGRALILLRIAPSAEACARMISSDPGARAKVERVVGKEALEKFLNRPR